MKFPIGSRWVIYDDKVPEVIEVVDYERAGEIGCVVTQSSNGRHRWVPAVLEWLAEPEALHVTF